MNFSKNRNFPVVCLVLIAFMLLGLIGCSKEARIERSWNKAESYFAENKIREAIIEYKSVIKLEPKHAKAHYKLGVCYLQLGMAREAYAELSQAVTLDPNIIEARNYLGALYLLSGDAAKAREQAEAILAKDPQKFPWPYADE